MREIHLRHFLEKDKMNIEELNQQLDLLKDEILKEIFRKRGENLILSINWELKKEK